jgi:hypothetical protein
MRPTFPDGAALIRSSDLDTLTPELAESFAATALGHVARPYPYALMRVVAGPGEVVEPRVQHPIFFGSYDWHSCVHGHWLLARLLRLYPELAVAPRIGAHFDATFTPANVAAESAFLDRPVGQTFERPYGWAWLLKLAAELAKLGGPWGEILAPLSELVAARLRAFLPKADYPIRSGAHFNTAFALLLALDYARAAHDGALAGLIVEKACAWHGADSDCQAWEPSGDDFLSPTLTEALLMRRVLEPEAFRRWFAAFLPQAGEGRPKTLFVPAKVSDRTDGKIAHLDGLNLSRAWCWRGVASALETADPARSRALDAAERHLAAATPHLTSDYMGEHWLASFAVLALCELA